MPDEPPRSRGRPPGLGKQSGSGRTLGTPNRATRPLQAATTALVHLAEHGRNERVRLQAACALLRAFGKLPQARVAPAQPGAGRGLGSRGNGGGA